VIEWIGFAAAALSTISLLPQLLKTVMTRSAGDLSMSMLLAFAAGVALWLVYGVALQERPLIVANAISLLLTLGQVALTLRYR
jgi:MtN3 and saliva related transmembrane protein